MPQGRQDVAAHSTHPELEYNLALIGGRGCGKSFIAKRLARTNRNFMLFSLDALIRYENQAATIPEIVEKQGWAAFRDHEYAVVEKVSAFESGALIDCGGGVVVDLDGDGNEIYSERKVKALKRHSLVVYLKRDTDYLISRIEDDPNRPALSTDKSSRDVMARRTSWYESAADWVVDCDEHDKTDLADEILAWFYERNGLK